MGALRAFVTDGCCTWHARPGGGQLAVRCGSSARYGWVCVVLSSEVSTGPLSSCSSDGRTPHGRAGDAFAVQWRVSRERHEARYVSGGFGHLTVPGIPFLALAAGSKGVGLSDGVTVVAVGSGSAFSSILHPFSLSPSPTTIIVPAHIFTRGSILPRISTTTSSGRAAVRRRIHRE